MGDIFTIRAEALPPGWRLVALPEIDSTNEEIRRRENETPGEGLVVSAVVQVAGRGRRGREWSSPAGNLYYSVRLAQAERLGDSAQMSFVAALALCDALAEVAPHLAPRLKWPNDVLIAGGKVSGILLETSGPWLILGMGINIVSAPVISGGGYPATSLRAEGADLSSGDVLPVILRHLKSCVDLWRGQGFTVIRRLWLDRAQGIGAAITARLQSGDEISGTFRDIDSDGALLVDVEGHGIRRIMAGDVFFPASGASPHRPG